MRIFQKSSECNDLVWWIQHAVFGAALALSVVYGLYGWVGQVFLLGIYWLRVSYTSLAIPQFLIIAFGTLMMLIGWVIGKLIGLIVKRVRYRAPIAGSAVALAVFTSVIAFIAAFPSPFWTLHHIDSTRLGGHVYHLGVVADFDGDDSSYVLFKCDWVGLFCKTHQVLPNWHQTMPAPVIVVKPEPGTVKIEWPSDGTP